MSYEQAFERIQALLYHLVRDTMPATDVERLADEVSARKGLPRYTTQTLVEFAGELASRVMREMHSSAQDPMYGLQNRLLVLTSFETGDSTAVPTTVSKARRALIAFNIKSEEIVDSWPTPGEADEPVFLMSDQHVDLPRRVMILDLANNGRICTLERLVQLGVWDYSWEESAQ